MICWKTPVWRWIGLLIAAVIIVKDQLIKWFIIVKIFQQHNPNFGAWLHSVDDQFTVAPIKVTSFFNLVMVWNKGVSFGMLQTNHTQMQYILSGVAVAIAIGFFVWLWIEPRPMNALSVGLIMGGALANVMDRLRFGAVADFFDFHIMGRHWPAFNVADAAIVIGVTLMFIHTVFFPHREVHHHDHD
jgi:signal peptidase II